MKTVFYKVLLIFIVPIVFTHCEKEPGPKITIPDANFLNALINQGVDKNGDGVISPAEAKAITDLRVSGAAISDLTGIEAFVNLEILWCSENQLTSLDVSNNTALENLSCGSNQLTSLDVSKNILIYLDCHSNQLSNLDINNGLQELMCDSNQLTSLDVSKNTILTQLDCDYNQLASLDVSTNTRLTFLSCRGNLLSNLDISNNSSIIFLNIKEMSSLYEVCVWEMPFPPSGVIVLTTNSPNVYFTTECSG